MDNMPPGFRFYPTEEELVSFYLRTKLDDNTRLDITSVIDRVIPVLDIYAFNPSQLPKYSGELCEEDPEQWFFFIPRQESEAKGGRPNRLTTSGYWKATGSPGYVYSSGNKVIGLKRTMVFYTGRAPSGNKTDWKMNEYKAIAHSPQPSSSDAAAAAAPTLRQEYSLCRVYKSTKCLRAFDRRPIEAAPQLVNIVEEEINEGVVPKVNSAETTISSSSAQYPAENDTYMEMEIAIESNEALWNWDQSNWFSAFT